MTPRKAMDAAYGVYHKLSVARGERMAVLVVGDKVVTKPERAAGVPRAEREHPEWIAGYYESARNIRANGISPEVIAADIMEVAKGA